MNSLFKDGLKLRDIKAAKSTRKVSRAQGKPGIVIVECHSKADKDSIMQKKKALKDSRAFSDVHIDSYKTPEQLKYEANFRLLFQNSNAKDKLIMKGGRLLHKSNQPNGDQTRGQNNGH